MAFREGQAAEEAVSNPDSAGELPSDAELAHLAGTLQERCVAANLTVSTAESCTGGLVGHAITSIDGSSGYYAGGAVTYSDRLKSQILGVSTDTLTRHGAVSAQTAVAMAEGARRAFETDLATSITGIAGPGGGSVAKPVGLVYVAVTSSAGTEVRRFHWTSDRDGNKRLSAAAALQLLLEQATALASTRA
jgi:nicotinamide-nucleotide amidase